MKNQIPLYDVFGKSYDLMIDWESRLKREGPFFKELFDRYSVQSVLDAACGTGQHAKLLAEWGLSVTGADPSSEMIRISRGLAGDKAQFVQAGFGEFASSNLGPFDAVICLGNSLPHLLTFEEILSALEDMRKVLKPEGLLILHNNNYDRILARNERFMPVASAEQDGISYLFFRFFDLGSEILNFNIATFACVDGKWEMRVDSTRHHALCAAELSSELKQSGFNEVERWGSFKKEDYLEEDSDNLILVCTRV